MEEGRSNNRSGGRNDSRGGSGGGRFGNNRGGSQGGNSGGRFGNNRGGGNRGNFNPGEKHKAICTKCKKECEVPFKPTEGRDVFCRECFANRN